jgi:hypothetical protein
MKLFYFSTAVLIVTFLSSCRTLQLGGLNSIKRSPVASAIVVHEDIVIKQLGATVTYPAARYTPRYQDSKGTFYQAPLKVFVFDTLMKRRTEIELAGFYLRDDRKGILHVWNRGSELVFKRPLSKFKTLEPPAFELVP